MDTRRVTQTLTTAAVLAVLAGCAGDGSPGAADGPDPQALDGDWILTEGSGADGEIPIPDDTSPTLTIDGDDWGGQACNHYGATVDVSGNEVQVGETFQTDMACMPQELMEAEAAYLTAFQQVTSVEVVDDQLVLRGEDVELVYAAVEAEADAGLTGTSWQLESLVHGDGPDGAVSQAMEPVELHLDDDGHVDAATGCRAIGGPYHLDGDRLDLTEAASDGHECEDDALADQDAHILEVLLDRDGVTYTIEGSRLELTSSDGLGLHYRAG